MSDAEWDAVVTEVRLAAERARGGARFYRYVYAPSVALASLADDLTALGDRIAALASRAEGRA